MAVGVGVCELVAVGVGVLVAVGVGVGVPVGSLALFRETETATRATITTMTASTLPTMINASLTELLPLGCRVGATAVGTAGVAAGAGFGAGGAVVSVAGNPVVASNQFSPSHRNHRCPSHCMCGSLTIVATIGRRLGVCWHRATQARTSRRPARFAPIVITMRNAGLRITLGCVGVLLVAGCSSTSESKSSPTTAPPTLTSSISTPSATASKAAIPNITGRTVIASGLTTPWGIGFLPDGSALVTERDTGVINRVIPKPGALATVVKVGQAPSYHPGPTEGGLLGIAIEPGPSPKQVFVYYTAPGDNRIALMSWDGERLGEAKPILTGIPAAGIHDGGRLAFGPDGFLYAGTGDAGQAERAQQLSSLGGKILRITKEGLPAPGNPFANSPIWSLGHRNVQGLAFDAQGRLWNSEFGQNLHDELNLVTRGSNYGWPIHEGIANDPRYSDPYVEWPTAEASPSGLAIIGDWAYLAALRGERLWQIGIAKPEPAGARDLLVGEYGRLRTPALAPDGSLWLTTSNTDGRGAPSADDDKILQLSFS